MDEQAIQFTSEELAFLQGVLRGMQFQGNAEAIRRALALHETVTEKVTARLDQVEKETLVRGRLALPNNEPSSASRVKGK